MKELKDYITNIPDFPQKGIIFRDVTSLLQSGKGFSTAVDEMLGQLDDVEFDAVLGLEARGFLFGAPIAYARKKSFVPVRKKGKLPRATVSAEYDLEYGKAEIEIHTDSLKKGDKVVIIDDLIATGGTLEAAARLVEQLGRELQEFTRYQQQSYKTMEQVRRLLSELSAVGDRSVYLMSGGFDLTVIIKGRTMREVARFVSEQLAPMENVLSTGTHFILKKYKDNSVEFDPADSDKREVMAW